MLNQKKSTLPSLNSSPIIPINATFHQNSNINSYLLSRKQSLSRRPASSSKKKEFKHDINPEFLQNKKTNSMIKLLLIGDAGVGKSALILRYCDDLFDEDNSKSTVGVDLKVKIVDVDGQYFKTVLWDTAGQERYRNVIPSLYKGSNGVILTYDVTNLDSFNDLNHWIGECNENCDLATTQFYLVGNKLDCDEKKVHKEDIKIFMENIKKSYPKIKIKAVFEVSAKYSNLVYGLFEMIIKDLVENRCYFDEQRLRNKKSIDLSIAREDDRHRSCCSY